MDQKVKDQKKKDLKLYFVAESIEKSDLRILYVLDVRSGIMMLSEKQVRGRSGEVPPFAEKALREVIISGNLITFQGVAETITRKLIGAFDAGKVAQECYAAPDARLGAFPWTKHTSAVLELLRLASGNRCSHGEMRLAVGE